MDLQGKKQHIERCIKLGLTLYKSMLIAGCTSDEMSLIENDDQYLRRIETLNAIYEHDLLKHIERAIAINVNMGKTTEVRWMLERINPEKWGQKSSVNNDIIVFPKIIVTEDVDQNAKTTINTMDDEEKSVDDI